MGRVLGQRIRREPASTIVEMIVRELGPRLPRLNGCGARVKWAAQQQKASGPAPPAAFVRHGLYGQPPRQHGDDYQRDSSLHFGWTDLSYART